MALGFSEWNVHPQGYNAQPGYKKFKVLLQCVNQHHNSTESLMISF